MATHSEISKSLSISTKQVQRLVKKGFLKPCPKGEIKITEARTALKRYLAKHRKGRPYDRMASEKEYAWLAQVITAANKKQRFSKWRFDQLQSAIWPHPDLDHDIARHESNPGIQRYARLFRYRPLPPPDGKILALAKKTLPNLQASLVRPLAAHFIYFVQFKKPLTHRPLRLTSKIAWEQKQFKAKSKHDRLRMLKKGGRRLKNYREKQYGMDKAEIHRLQSAHERDGKCSTFYKSEQGIAILNGDRVKAKDLYQIHHRLANQAHAAIREIEKKRLYFLAKKLDRQFDEDFSKQPLLKFVLGQRDHGGLKNEKLNLSPKRVLPFYKILGVPPRAGQRAGQRTEGLFKILQKAIRLCSEKHEKTDEEADDRETVEQIFSDNRRYNDESCDNEN